MKYCVLALGLFLVTNQGLAQSRASAEKCDAQEIKPNSWFKSKVVALSDGDTIHVEGSKPGKIRRIRLLNIDTPETHFMDLSQGKPGEDAAQELAKMIPVGTEVKIQFDQSPCDMNKRFLGFVFAGELEVNFEMVRRGMAVSLCFAPNLTKCGRYTGEALSVMKSLSRPSVFKRAGGVEGAQVPHEFRYESSNRPEAVYVGDINTKVATEFRNLMKIKNPLHRIFFLSEADVTNAGFKLGASVNRSLSRSCDASSERFLRPF